MSTEWRNNPGGGFEKAAKDAKEVVDAEPSELLER